MLNNSQKKLAKLPERKNNAHKYSCGKVLVIAGSPGMSGAGYLASMAALRSGAGLVTWVLPKNLFFIGEVLAVEILTMFVPETTSGAIGVDSREIILEAAREVSTVILGPGLPVAGETGELMRLLIPEIYAPLILDAGAISAIGKDYAILAKRKNKTVLTPHMGEMARLVERTSEDIEKNKIEYAKKYANITDTVMVLKGSETVVTDGKDIYINDTGNPGMATAGSGDILTGVIAALIAQGLDCFEAAKLAVYLHGLAGDIGIENKGIHGLIARDILENLPNAFLKYNKT